MTITAMNADAGYVMKAMTGVSGMFTLNANFANPTCSSIGLTSWARLHEMADLERLLVLLAKQATILETLQKTVEQMEATLKGDTP